MKHSLKRIYLIGITAGIFASAQLSASSLAERSPFLPPNYGESDQPPTPTRAPTNFPQVTFHGYSGTPDGWEFVIRDPNINQILWLKEGETKNSYTVSNFNPTSQTISLIYNGMSKQFSLDDSPTVATAPPARASNTTRITSTNRNAASARVVPPRRSIVLPTNQRQNNANANNNQNSNAAQGGRNNQVNLISGGRSTSNSSPQANNQNSNPNIPGILQNNLNNAVNLLTDPPNTNATQPEANPNADTANNGAIPRRRFIPARVDPQ
jgi:hypothetical protein